MLPFTAGVGTAQNRTDVAASGFEVLPTSTLVAPEGVTATGDGEAPAPVEDTAAAEAEEPPAPAVRPVTTARSDDMDDVGSDTFDPADPPAPAEPAEEPDVAEDAPPEPEPDAGETTPEPQQRSDAPKEAPPEEQQTQAEAPPPPPPASEDDEPAGPDPAPAISAQASAADTAFSLIQDTRASAGVAALQHHSGADSVAQSWAERMATDVSLRHNPDFASQLWTAVGSGAVVENVGQIRPADAAAMHQRFLNSPNHRANIVGAFTFVEPS